MSIRPKAASTRSARAWRKASPAARRPPGTSPRGSRARARTSFRFWQEVRRPLPPHPPPSRERVGVGGKVTAFGGREPRAEIAGSTALKAEPEQRLSPTEQLEQQNLPFSRSEARARCPRRGCRAARRGQGQGLRRRSLRRMRQLHAGAQRHVSEVRHVRWHDGVQLEDWAPEPHPIKRGSTPYVRTTHPQSASCVFVSKRV